MTEIKKILCPVEFGDGATSKVVEWAAGATKAFAGELLLINVVPQFDEYSKVASSGEFIHEIGSLAHRNMESLLKQDLFKEIKVTGKIISGPPAQAIIDTAKTEKVDMIVMGTHGRAGVEKFLFGSVAQKVVQHSEIPVLTLKP